MPLSGDFRRQTNIVQTPRQLLTIYQLQLVQIRPLHTWVSNDLPLKFHPAAIRASAVFDTPHGVMGATGGKAKLPNCVALEPVAAMIPA